MCNLAGWVGGSINKQGAKILYDYIWPGNYHATGVALHLGKKLSIRKKPLAAPLFIKTGFDKWYNNNNLAGLLHARFATNGSPKNNENNHPHYDSKTGSVLVHKGVISPIQTFPSNSECDSEQLLHSLDSLGLRGGIENCPGWASIAYISGKDFRTVWLYTNVGGLWLKNYGGGMWLFASKSLLGKGAKKIESNHWIGMTLDGKLKSGPKVRSNNFGITNLFSTFSFPSGADYGGETNHTSSKWNGIRVSPSP